MTSLSGQPALETRADSLMARPPAMLKNVSALLLMADQLLSRPVGLSGFGCFSGFSGYGKTMAAQHCQNRRGAIYLEAREWWTRKVLLQMLLEELGVSTPPRTIADMMQRIIRLLGANPEQLIIIDEADKLVDKGMIEFVRGLQGDTQVPILLVGEELLPQKLRAVERVFNRVIEWGLAEPCDLDDARLLAARWCPGVEIADQLLGEMVRQANGNARKIAATLNKARQFSVNNALKGLTLDGYAGGFFTGEPPARRR